MIGVPNKLFKKSVLLEIQKEYKDTSVKIKDKITGAYKNINIIDVSIYREADAALLWHVRKCSEFDNDLCMVTVGFRTTEIGTYNNKMKFNDKLSKSIELGNKTALEYVQRKIKDDDNVMRSLSEIDSSDRYDSLKKVAYNNLSEKISQEIEGLLINLSEFDVFIGGGTALNMNFDGYDVIPDAQMATAKGLFTVGNKVFKQEDYMKKTSSFNLEENTYNEIIEYKDKYKLSSRNMALEMMLTERRTMLNMLKNASLYTSDTKTIDINSKMQNESNIFNDSIEDSFTSMPD